MKYNHEIHHRRTIRLIGYDYSQHGYYFITICTFNGDCLLGDISNGEIFLNRFGDIVAESWEWLAFQYKYIKLDEWVIMPNHIHGIIVIKNMMAKQKPLGQLIGAFKTVSTIKNKYIESFNGNTCVAKKFLRTHNT